MGIAVIFAEEGAGTPGGAAGTLALHTAGAISSAAVYTIVIAGTVALSLACVGTT